ncbi:hypothetical protein, partial [Enterobacter asburiae]|uniref:hypothetical protein n=1 Tax=Enterobacter asburiae TaxID=61645 RepID=UPI00197D6894
LYLPRIGQVENMSVEGLFVHGGDLWRLNTPLSCLQPPQQGKTLLYTVLFKIFSVLQGEFYRLLPGHCSGG